MTFLFFFTVIAEGIAIIYLAHTGGDTGQITKGFCKTGLATISSTGYSYYSTYCIQQGENPKSKELIYNENGELISKMCIRDSLCTAVYEYANLAPLADCVIGICISNNIAV